MYHTTTTNYDLSITKVVNKILSYFNYHLLYESFNESHINKAPYNEKLYPSIKFDITLDDIDINVIYIINLKASSLYEILNQEIRKHHAFIDTVSINILRFTRRMTTTIVYMRNQMWRDLRTNVTEVICMAIVNRILNNTNQWMKVGDTASIQFNRIKDVQALFDRYQLTVRVIPLYCVQMLKTIFNEIMKHYHLIVLSNFRMHYSMCLPSPGVPQCSVPQCSVPVIQTAVPKKNRFLRKSIERNKNTFINKK